MILDSSVKMLSLESMNPCPHRGHLSFEYMSSNQKISLNFFAPLPMIGWEGIEI